MPTKTIDIARIKDATSTEMVSEVRNFIVRAVCVALGSMLTGFVFFNTSLLVYTNPAFQFIVIGVFGGIVLATTRISSVPKSLAVIAFAGFFMEMLLTPFGKPLIVRDAFFFAGTGGTLVLFRFFFYEQLKRIPIARPLLLGAMLTVNGIVVTAILHFVTPILFDGSETSFGALFVNMNLGFLLGVGLGAGDEMGEIVSHRWGTIMQRIVRQLSPTR